MIDGGPARTGRSSDRQPTYRSEVARSQPQMPMPVDPYPRDGALTRTSPPEPPRQKRRLGGVVVGLTALLLIGAIAIAGYLLVPQLKNNSSGQINADRYQAVFFSNGQVYFGKLEIIDKDYYSLTDAFYVQADAATTDTEAADQASITGQKLIKRGAEVYGPESPMTIDRTQVMFFENLRPDSQVSKLMRDYK